MGRLIEAPLSAPARRLRAAAALAAALVVAGGCRPPPTARPGLTDFRIASVEFEGVEQVDHRDLREVLETQENAFNPFVPINYYNRFSVAADVERIETFYASHGFFDAAVVDYRLDFEEGRRDRVRITFEVVEGEPSYLLSDARYATEGLRAIEDVPSLIAESRLRAGRRFSRSAVDAERLRLQRALQERSYARARVSAAVYVNRERHTVEVFFFFDPGISCVFGEISVIGTQRVPPELIQRNVDLEAGNQYRHSLLRQSQVDLYDLDVFTHVEVRADLSEQATGPVDGGGQERVAAAMAAAGFRLLERLGGEPAGVRVAGLIDNIGEIESANPFVPIVIEVSESPSARYKFGGGLGIESSRTEGYGRSNAVWRHVVAPLNRLEVDGRVGYAWLPSVFDPNDFSTGVVGQVSAGVSRPKVFFGIFDASLRIGFERGIEADHAFSRPSARISIDNRIGEFTRVSLGYVFSINLTQDFANAPEISARQRSSCDQLPRTFRMGYVDASVRRERRDQGLEDRRHDVQWSVGAQLGEGGLGDYPYVRLQPDLRHYVRLGRNLTLASRVGVGTVFDFGEPVPRSQCLFLGGGSSVRGYADRRVGPHVEADVPNGGVASYVLNIEPRFALSDLFGMVVFADAGEVNTRIAFDPSFGGATGVHAAAGAGLRVFTPIGPLRFDLGYRLTPGASNAGRLRRLAFFLSLGEAF